MLVLVVILAAGAAVGYLTLDWGSQPGQAFGFGCLASAFLFFSLRNFFLPTRIRLDESGITVKEFLYTRRKSWSECKSLHLDKNGVLVSPFTFVTRLENFRGVYLRFDGNKDEVLAFLKAHMKSEKENEPGVDNG